MQNVAARLNGGVAISPKILTEMVQNPEKAAYYEGVIDKIYDVDIPQMSRDCASRGLVFSSWGVIVHDDGTITHVCGCEDSPERVREVEAEHRAKLAKRAAQRKAYAERRAEAKAQAEDLAKYRRLWAQSAGVEIAGEADTFAQNQNKLKFEIFAAQAKMNVASAK